jgi:hypothetical protein
MRQRTLLCNSFVNTQQYWSHCQAAACAQQWKYCWKRCFLCGPLWGSIIRLIEFSSVQSSQCSSVQLVQCSEWVRGLLQFSPCELLLLEAGSWSMGIVRKPSIRGTSAIGSRYWTTGEDTADWEELVCAVVNCRVCELVISLWLLVVTFCGSSINPIINPNPIYSHS